MSSKDVNLDGLNEQLILEMSTLMAIIGQMWPIKEMKGAK